MKRPQLPGLDVGGGWTLPVRAEIEPYEFAFVLEVPEQEVREIFGDAVPIRSARDLLRKLAGQGRLEGSEETWLFRQLIAGRIGIDAAGDVRQAVEGRPVGGVFMRRVQDMSLDRSPPPQLTWDQIEAGDVH